MVKDNKQPRDTAKEGHKMTDFDMDSALDAIAQEDRCPGCRSSYNGRYGAFECGYPSADCPAMLADDTEIQEDGEEADSLEAFLVERAKDVADEEAWEELFEAIFTHGTITADTADCLVMDEWEAEWRGELYLEPHYEEALANPPVGHLA